MSQVFRLEFQIDTVRELIQEELGIGETEAERVLASVLESGTVLDTILYQARIEYEDGDGDGEE